MAEKEAITNEATAEAVEYAGVRFVNLTPHEVNLTDGNGLMVTFKPSGQVARVERRFEKTTMEVKITDDISIRVPLRRVHDGEVVNLPGPEEGTVYIVSFLVAEIVRRPDVVSPITDETAFRAEDGKTIIGVRGFQTYV